MWDILGRVFSTLPQVSTEMRFVRYLVSILIQYVGLHLGVPWALIHDATRLSEILLPHDVDLVRWGRAAATRWANLLSAHGMPKTACRVRMANGLAAA